MLGAPEVKWPKLLLVLSILVLAYLLQSFLQLKIGWSFDFVLVLLISATFFLSLLELVFLILVAWAILAWQPGISLDIVLLFALPLLVYGARRILSWDSWIANIIFTITSVSIFYLSMGPGLLTQNWLLFVNNILGSAIFAAILFFLLEYIYAEAAD